MGVILGLLCFISSAIIHYFTEKSPDELNQIGFLVNLLTRLSRISMFIPKLIHPIKLICAIFCLYLILFSIDTSNNSTKLNEIIIKPKHGGKFNFDFKIYINDKIKERDYKP